MTSVARPGPGSGQSFGAGRSPSSGTWQRLSQADWPYRIITLAVLAVVWQVLADDRGSLLIPNFTDTMGALARLVIDPALWNAIFISNQALAIGFTASLVLGIPIGLLMGRFRTAERFTDVYVNIMIVTPMAALIPILLMSVGIDLEARVIIVVLFAVPMVIVNSRAGVRQVDPAQIEMARSFGASEAQIWKRVLLPGSVPAVMTGVRIAVGRAVTGMVIVELLLVSVGLGRLILRYQSTFRPAELYATIVVVVIEALILISAARWVERRAAGWAATTRAYKE